MSRSRRIDRHYQYLDLLCSSGAGIQAIASRFCQLCTQLLGADASFLMWFTQDGQPLVFYHETAPPELKDLFISQLDPMFFTGEEISSWSLVFAEGPSIGKMLAPGMQERFRGGNIYRHLCLPLGHGDMLDMSVNGGAAGCAGLAVWHKDGTAMTHEHAQRLEPVLPMMERALRHVDDDGQWQTTSTGVPHLLVRRSDCALLAIDDNAERLLRNSQLLRANFPRSGAIRAAPDFVAGLLTQLDDAEFAQITLPVVDGRLICRATRSRSSAPESEAEPLVLVTLELQVPREVALVDQVMALALTPLQREIALFALRGRGRAQCQNHLGLSSESMKKHVRAVLRATGAETWEHLSRSVRPVPASEFLTALRDPVG